MNRRIRFQSTQVFMIVLLLIAVTYASQQLPQEASNPPSIHQQDEQIQKKDASVTGSGMLSWPVIVVVVLGLGVGALVM